MYSLDEFRAEVAASVGAETIVSGDDPAARDRYFVDWTGRFRVPPTMVVRPSSTEDVVEVVRAARRHRVALVPQGGNTGLVGGGVPHRGEVVVSLERMREIGTVDAAGRQLTAGAGATLAAVQAAATAVGLRYPVDFGARGSATIGGTVATNAGGINVLRHGMTRRHVVGVEAVLGSGEVVSRLRGLVKDNTGYDFASLLCGSEGTLAIVTAVRLQLAPNPAGRTTALVGLDSVGSAVDLLARLTVGVDTLEAAELMLGPGIELVAEVMGAPCPLGRHRAYLLVESVGDTGHDQARMDVLATLPEASVASAVTAGQRDQLWRLRDEHTASINTLGAPLKFDVTVPLSDLPDFVDRIEGVVQRVVPSARVFVFGHAADGNMHVNVIGSEESQDEIVTEAVLADVAGRGGSISAEHGIGVAKKKWLSLGRSPAEIELMRRTKAVFDPDGILNPNVLLP